jgi:15-cis-phytoene synthase
VSVSVEAAYAQCESIARREAKNFYYAFRVLPKSKRRAICAVYAFMRHADDLADDEHLPRERRLLQTQTWLAGWHRAASGNLTDDPVFVALRDAQQRFQIPAELLDQLVQGTTMDLTAPQSADNPPGVAVYRTFDELYQYCYLVASVVGLVCIRIFGYTDARAEELAEKTGIAFQLTNILRDVREDAERGRIYLPLADLESHNVTVEQLAAIRDNRQLTLDERALMEMEAGRAREYYAAADSLLPLISPDSRAALWVLVTIYRRLLEKIVSEQYQVFGDRVTLSTPQKIWILLRGMWMAFRLRIRTR